jgi:hypothetical protein
MMTTLVFWGTISVAQIIAEYLLKNNLAPGQPK